jgi:LuxR family maltose regulon positive regulatory protein
VTGGDPIATLRQAIDGQDWAAVVRTVEVDWSALLQRDRGMLDEALRRVPGTVATSIRWRAIRAMRFHEVQFDLETVDPLEVPFPTNRRTLSRLAESDAAYDTLLTAQLLMIAFRVRGAALQAATHADIARVVARIARVRRPEVADLEPRVMLQIGVTYLLVDRLDDAIECLRDAYERSGSGTSSHVRPDAAVKLSLAFALMGDVTGAQRWLARFHGVQDETAWMRSRIDVSEQLARAFVALETLDRQEARSALHRVNDVSSHERLWSPMVDHARHRYDLLFGDSRQALRRLERARGDRVRWLGEGTTMRPLLEADEAELLMATGNGSLAGSVLSAAAAHPALGPARARLALLADGPAAALRVTRVLDRFVSTPGAQLQLLAVRAVAQERLGEHRGAEATIREAAATMEATGTRQGMLGVPRAELLAITQRAGVELAELPPREPFPATLTTIRFTDRERSILGGLARGESPQQLAGRLSLSPNTVKSHLHRIYRKLDVSTRNDAIDRAIEHGLLVED